VTENRWNFAERPAMPHDEWDWLNWVTASALSLNAAFCGLVSGLLVVAHWRDSLWDLVVCAAFGGAR